METHIQEFKQEMAESWIKFNNDRENRPKCSVQGCTNYAHNAGRRKKDKSIIWRKNPADKTHTTYICQDHHEVGMYEHKKYRLLKKNYCENIDRRLGFDCPTFVTDEIAHVFPLSVDHIDGNPKNNDSKNLQTLCLTCHGIKTQVRGDAGTPGRGALGLLK